MSRLLEKEFDKFALLVFGDISEQQYIDLRRTFIAGASAFYFLISETSEAEELERAKSLCAEIAEFNNAVKRGEK